MSNETLKNLVQNSLEDMKAVDVQIIDLAGKADFADYMIIASGTSDRHLHAMADKVQQDAKAAGSPALGVEGEDSRDWVLVDLGDIIVHLMRPETRQLYALDKLWSLPATRQSS
ncbi:ribosome silencing factor [Suttonella ornithocola]|uniref:Ribosomal silencing factor RsfS n=1 Tax=Suttonella ornithocola TaxID=279832 RepID=A0A380MY29_9GAMM|nr:ribosome silencing factor [Suttonella ornithocola]SUO97124.1 ribosome-associated protein [Suttonella ornithocola]